jgi:hypothetical protein
MKQILMSLISLSVIILVSCNNGTDSKQENIDSVKNAKKVQDSITKVDDSIAIVRRNDTLNALGLKNVELSDSSCPLIAKALDSNLIEEPIDFTLFMGKMLACRDKEWNQNHPDKPEVTLMSQDENNKVLFNTVSIKTADDIANVTKTILTIGIAYKTGNPILTAIGSQVSNYTVNSYLDAAKRNDPLILIYPSAIPAKQFVGDASKITVAGLKELSKLDATKPFTLQFEAAKQVTQVLLLSVKASANYAIQNGVAVLKNGVKLPVVGNGPLNPTNPGSPIGPLGPVGPIVKHFLHF